MQPPTKTMTTYSENNGKQSGISKYWLARVQAAQDQSSQKSTRYGLRQRNHGSYLISDTYEMSTESNYWTDNPDMCQVYYDLDNAFRCAGILASITNEDIEVVALDE